MVGVVVSDLDSSMHSVAVDLLCSCPACVLDCFLPQVYRTHANHDHEFSKSITFKSCSLTIYIRLLQLFELCYIAIFVMHAVSNSQSSTLVGRDFCSPHG